MRSGPSRSTLSGLHRLLRNPYYKGVVVFDGVEHPGRHEPLIDPVTWEAVQDILTARRNGERSRVHDHYLKGTVFCFECGRRLIVQHTRTKTGRVYEYFVCHRRRDSPCQQRKALPMAQVEQRVEDLYRTIELNPDRRERVEQIVLATLRRQQVVNSERLAEIAEESPTVEANQTKTELANLAREKANLEPASVDIEQRVHDALDLLQHAHTAYTNASTTVRKQLNRAIFTGIFLGAEPDQIRTELNEPYVSIAKPGDD